MPFFPERNMQRSPNKKVEQGINKFKGLNIAVNASQIDINESPDMLNMELDDNGALDKRRGFFEQFETPIVGDGIIKNGLIEYPRDTGTIYLVAQGTDLYIWDVGLQTYVLEFSGLSGNPLWHFTFGNFLYILDGEKYYRYDGTSVVEVSTIAYIPTLSINTPPTGGTANNEIPNMISTGFKQEFSGDAVATLYQLLTVEDENGDVIPLDATPVTIDVDGSPVVEGVGFTVNRALYQIDFTGGSAPYGAPSNGTNNVITTAYVTIQDQIDRINRCTVSNIFGGANDTGVFLSGNDVQINEDYQSETFDPTYFPETQNTLLGSDINPIIGYAQQYDYQIIIKGDIGTDTKQFKRIVSYIDEDVVYQILPLNSDVGCQTRYSIQDIENTPHYLSVKGAFGTVRTDVQSKEDVKHVSKNIDKNIDNISTFGLLELGDLENYISVVFNNKYYLANPTSGIVWVYDYRYISKDANGKYVGQWYKFNNIYANAFLEIEGILYFGDSREGQIHRFYEANDGGIGWSDNGDAIEAYTRSKIFNFDQVDRVEILDKIFFSIKVGDSTSVTLSVRSDITSGWAVITDQFRNSLMTYSLIAYSKFTYGANIFPKAKREKLRWRNLNYLQLEFRNDINNESLGLLTYKIAIRPMREVR